DDIFTELKAFFAVCGQEGVPPGGVHLELTHEAVTECLGGAEEVLDANLSERYLALCDPRLNARQSLDLAFQLGEMLQQN
ncbi:MAG TPA: 3-deoxy-7-phosphoheptulonate synthase, partial [Actinomycetota bacterium]|nr:3-deoxy-7-phosphoheptulonate synthase [Actinomycetota bacterium]